MASSKLLLLIVSFIAHQVLTTNASGKNPLVPALFIFGDSGADAGNNNHLNTRAKANIWPYGSDLNNVRGRFTNGKTGADFAAINLGLPIAPPYLNLSSSERSRIVTGINYASGACGILNTTREGECLSLAQQVKYFTSTVTHDLPKAIKNQRKLKRHLAKSIYLLLVGDNDYLPSNVNKTMLAKNYSDPRLYADDLLNEITIHIKTLYKFGARKFVLSSPSICEPFNYIEVHCKSRYYADKLPLRVLNLQAKLPGSLFTIYDGANLFKNIIMNPQSYGITHQFWEPCFVNGSVCEDRSKYLTFDGYGHPTEKSYEITSTDCFNGTSCRPYTLFELAKARIYI